MSTVVCCWVKGHVPYPPEYVIKLRNMVSRWMDRPYQFKVLTDAPEKLPKGFDTVKIPNPRPMRGWWSKLEAFNSAHGFNGRMLYLDLDSLVVASLGPILDYPSKFALIPHSGNFTGFAGDTRQLVQRFNSSCMVWDAGVNRRLYDDWTPQVANRLHGDQDWIGEQMPDADMLPIEWCPRLSTLDGLPPGPEAKVVLAKTPKNEEAAKRYPWFAAEWV